MYGCESWAIKKAECWRIDAFELWWWRRLWRVPWTASRSNQSILKEISPNIHWKDYCWSWISNTLAPDAKNWLIGKDPDTRKDWRQEEKGVTEDEMEMVGWHYQLNGHEFEQAPRVGDGQGSLACCNPWDRNELDMTEQLNWTELNAGNLGSILGSRSSPGEGNGNPLQYSCLENPMDRGVWGATVHGSKRVGHN